MFNDNPEHSPAYKIFHYEFNCTIPTMFLYSTKYLETFGISSSGDKNIDEGQAMAPTTCRLTIAAMAQYHHEGAPIGLLDPVDAARIYTYVKQHLMDWSNNYTTDFNRRTAPTDELEILENFATDVYKAARPHLEASPTNSSLLDFINRHSSQSIITRTVNKREEVKSNLPTEHKNIINDLVVEVAKRNKRNLFRS